MIRNYYIAGLALAICGLQSAVLAEETLLPDTPKLDAAPVTAPIKRAPLSGKVSVEAAHIPVKKVVVTPKVLTPKITKPVLDASANATTYRGIPMQGSLDMRRQQLMRGYANQMAVPMQTQLKKYTNPDDAPYRWAQAGDGGYYDASGTYKGPNVWGDKVLGYGGHFYDGTPVPKGPVQINKMGHIWWQNNLSNRFVKQEEVRGFGTH